MSTADTTQPVVKTFRITTYFKHPKGSRGLTQLGSNRLTIAQALEWVLQELPDEAWDVVERATAENGDTVTLTIDWSKVPSRGMAGLRR